MKVSEEDFVRLSMVGERIVYKVGALLHSGRLTYYDTETRRASLLYFMDTGPEYQAVAVHYDEGLEANVCWCHQKELSIEGGLTKDEDSPAEEQPEDSSATSGSGEDEPGELQEPVGVSAGDGSTEADKPDAAADS